MASVFWKEEKIFYKMVYYTPIVRNRVSKLKFKYMKNGLF